MDVEYRLASDAHTAVACSLHWVTQGAAEAEEVIEAFSAARSQEAADRAAGRPPRPTRECPRFLEARHARKTRVQVVLALGRVSRARVCVCGPDAMLGAHASSHAMQ